MNKGALALNQYGSSEMTLLQKKLIFPDFNTEGEDETKKVVLSE